MKPQSAQNSHYPHPAPVLNARMSEHINYIRHKAALLQKMLLLKTAISDSLNAGFRSRKIQSFNAPRNNGRGYRQVPQILLQGVWLRKTGFEIDDYAQIIALPQLLIITSSGLASHPLIEPPEPKSYLLLNSKGHKYL